MTAVNRGEGIRFDSVHQLRIAGIAALTIQMLPSSQADEWWTKWSKLRIDAAIQRSVLSDIFFTTIGSAEEGTSRSVLVQARRHAFNRRFCRALAALTSHSSSTEELQARVQTSAAAESLLNAHEVGGDESFAAWLGSERRALAAVVGLTGFRDSLTVATPSGYGNIDRYISTVLSSSDGSEQAVLDKKLRNAERAVLGYFLRSGAKISPFSRFTGVALTRYDSNGVDTWDSLPSEWTVFTYPNVRPFSRAAQRVLELPNFRGAAYAAWSSATQIVDDRIQVSRTKYDFADGGRDSVIASESRLSVRHGRFTAIVRELLHKGECEIQQLAVSLSVEAEIPLSAATEAIERLRSVGILEVPALFMHPHELAPETGILDVAARSAGTAPVELIEAITTYTTATQRIAAENALERVSSISEARRAVGNLYHAVDLEADPPRTLVYEDAIISSRVYNGRAERLESRQDDFRSLVDFVPLLDDSQVQRALMRGYFHERFGEGGLCSDVNGFLWAFREELFDSYLARDSVPDPANLAADPWLRWGDAYRWVQARQSLESYLNAAIEAEGSEVDIREIPSIIAAEPALALEQSTYPYRHYYVFLQHLPGSRAVINKLFGSPGFSLSRFASRFAPSAPTKAADLELRARASGTILAEISGGTVHTNLNLHPPLLQNELVLPGWQPGKGTTKGIRINDLKIVDRPDQGRLTLVDTTTGLEVLPCFLGYLVTAALPITSQLFLLFGPPNMFSRSWWSHIETPPDRVLELPRLTIGGLVASRRTWRIPRVLLPAEKVVNAQEYGIWRSWFLDHGIPQRCYVRPLGGKTLRRKPQYLDTSSVLMLQSLTHELGDCETIEVTEALPELDDTVASVAGSPRISEVVVGFDISTSLLGRST